MNIRHLTLSLLIMLPSLVVARAEGEIKFTAPNKGVEIRYQVTGQDPLTAEVIARDESDDLYSGDVEIPANVTHDGKTYAVTAIGRKAFDLCAEMTSISLPPSVTTIGFAAFQDCYGLTSVSIPEGVARIDTGAFNLCDNLATIDLPSTLTNVEYMAFSECISLTSIDIPASVTTIGREAFWGCYSLASVTLRTGLKTIGEYAFGGTGLTAIDIPASVTAIGERAFWGCYSLASATLRTGLETIGDLAFRETGLTAIDIPPTVETIGKEAFGGCSSLATANIQDGVKTIGDMAFNNCTSLAAVKLPSTLTTIGLAVFQCCSSLTTIDLPEGLTTIPDNTFFECTGLTSLGIPASVTEIGETAMYKCHSMENIKLADDNKDFTLADGALCDKSGRTLLYLPSARTSFTIPDKVETLAPFSLAFSHLTSLTIPATVTTIEKGALQGCLALDALSVDEGNEAFMMMDGALYDKTGQTLIICPPSRTSFTFPAAVTKIAPYAFSNGKLTDISIPDVVTALEEGVFQESMDLTTITLGTGIRSIGAYVFYRIPLSSLTIKAAQTPAMDPLAFNPDNGIIETDLTVHVPNAALQSYLNDEVWNSLIGNISFLGYEPTGIERTDGDGPTTAVRIYTANGILHIEAAQAVKASVITFSGATLIDQRTLPAGHSQLAGLPHTPLIVRLSDGTSVKINNCVQ